MSYVEKIQSWPQAIAVIGLGFCAVCTIAVFFIALSESKFPWEK